MDSVTTMLAKGTQPEEICKTALEGFQIEKLDEFRVHYACNCSKEKFARAMLTIGALSLIHIYSCLALLVWEKHILPKL